MTLAFNLSSEVEQRTKELYERNPDKNYVHYIVDLGFPLEFGADIPDDIEAAKNNNSRELKSICKKYGSKYLQFPNIGVSQNYTQFMKAVGLKDEDVLICCDPDEVVHTDGWVDAIASVLRSENKIAYAGLCMEDQVPYFNALEAKETITINGVRVHKIFGVTSCAQWGLSGRFLNLCGGIGVPDGWAVYGYIESVLYNKLQELGWDWCILPDYLVEHIETSPLYRAYKTDTTSGNFTGEKQILFEDWLKTK